MKNQNLAKQALDTIIRKSRVHLYKPIQIAEILYHHRTEDGWNLEHLESYRNVSKRWRDEVSLLLVGRKSTSSQKYQDNIFDTNAVPPHLLSMLGEINKKENGIVEFYIYKALQERLSSVRDVEQYITTSTADTFQIKKLVSFFQNIPGLKRSIDKMYEILVYALFTAIVHSLKAQITLEIKNKDQKILNDFEEFIKMVLGIDKDKTKIVLPATLYRVGVTNAADKGLDIWANFGPAIQVKHLTLTHELVEDISEEITADKIVIVCLDAEKNSINSLLMQVGWSEKIQGIITLHDLDTWYRLCLNTKYRNDLGLNLLKDIEREFRLEFPSNQELSPFMEKRGYYKLALPSEWEIGNKD